MKAFRFLTSSEHAVIACEQCGALGHGNIGCIVCLRWIKRETGSVFTRLLIKMAERRIGIYEGGVP